MILDFRPILFVVGILLATLGVAMAAPCALDIADGNLDWEVFAGVGGFTLFVGIALALTNRVPVRRLTLRQGFLLTTVTWLVLTMFAALPFVFSELRLSYTDAFFEAMSGITTTGSTVIKGLDHAPRGLLLWRALLQWLGGVGIVVMAVSVLPILRVGGMQIFRVEAFEAQEKIMPRAGQIASWIVIIYILFTLIWSLGLWLMGMDGFHAIVHAMTTIATGGFSSADNSVGEFRGPLVESFVTLGMVVGAMPFFLYLKAMGAGPMVIVRDSQVRCFLAIAAASVLAVAGWLWTTTDRAPGDALVASSFNVVSIMTGTGYTSEDFETWGTFPVVVMFLLMFVGGCAGSTACGIKVFRFQILFSTARTQFARLMHPHGVFVPHYNQRPIDDEVSHAVMGFFVLYIVAFAALAAILGALGLDFITAVSGAATAISNVGPGLGPVIGPSGTFAPLPDAAKWALSAGMLLGRLELFTVLILFIPRFWRG
jgi:trk system potassium uptake protein TrkH